MQIIRQDTSSFDGKLMTNFTFDKLNTPDAVIRLVHVLCSCGLKIESLTAMEFGDYDNAKKIVTYSNQEKLNDMVDDFEGIRVETYNMHGTLRQAKFIATVYADSNSFAIRYDPAIQKEVEAFARNIAD